MPFVAMPSPHPGALRKIHRMPNAGTPTRRSAINTLLNHPATANHHHGIAAKTAEQDDMRLAKKRAGARVGFMIHATVFVAVGLLFLVMSQTGITPHAAPHHAHWPMFPMAGWAIGLFFHGLAVYARGPFSGIRERMIQSELQRIRMNRNATH